MSQLYSAAVADVQIPNRPLFRAQEVCEIADVQPYVLRSWEAEFPDLGVAKPPGGVRFYRRADVERVLRIKHLLFVDGLTLAGVRRRMSEEGLRASDETVTDADMAALADEATRDELRNVRRGLRWILDVLSGQGVQPEDRVLQAVRGGGAATASRARTGSARRSQNTDKRRLMKGRKTAKPLKKRPVRGKRR